MATDPRVVVGRVRTASIGPPVRVDPPAHVDDQRLADLRRCVLYAEPVPVDRRALALDDETVEQPKEDRGRSHPEWTNDQPIAPSEIRGRIEGRTI
jgi:hypothetical protein